MSVAATWFQVVGQRVERDLGEHFDDLRVGETGAAGVGDIPGR